MSFFDAVNRFINYSASRRSRTTPRRPARRRRLRLHITDIKNSAKYNFYNYNYYYNIKLQLNRNKYRINFRTNFSLIKFL